MRSIEELITRHRPGHALDRRFYTDPDIYALELERIVTRHWVLAGHASELTGPGDFKRVDVADESAIVVHGEDGRIRAFANVCRHRGSRVCLASRGHARRFSCPYHGWTYDTRGRLTAARSMPDGFDASAMGLKPVSYGEIHGLMFVCFCAAPPRLEGAVRDLEPIMSRFDFPGLKVAAHRVYELAANWKLLVENYQECYHCATAHPEYARMHTLTVEPQKRERLQAAMRTRMLSCGLDDLHIDHVDGKARPGEIGFGYQRTAMFEGYLTGSEDGKPVAPLLGKLQGYDGGASDFTFGPFSFLLAYSDHVLAYVFVPVDHNHSRAELYWLVRGDAQEGRDYELDRLTWLWDRTMRADKEIVLNTARGLRSRYYEPGPLSTMEQVQGAYLDWLLEQLGSTAASVNRP